MKLELKCEGCGTANEINPHKHPHTWQCVKCGLKNKTISGQSIRVAQKTKKKEEKKHSIFDKFREKIMREKMDKLGVKEET